MITLPTGSLINIKAYTKEGTITDIPLNTKLAELVPQLSLPSWINIVANTSAPIVNDFANVQFRVLAKSEPTVVYENGQYVVHPSKLQNNNVKIGFAQITPTEIAEKTELDEIDVKSGNFEDVLAKTIANWILQVNKSCEVQALKSLAFECQEFQKKLVGAHSTATDFANGAHQEKVTTLTPQKAYDLLSKLRQIIPTVGLESAKTAMDANFKFATGINLSDIIILCSYEFLDTLMQNNGLFASDAGFSVFAQMGIKKVLGFDILPLAELPNGVHFIALTTGYMGALANGSVSNGHRFTLVPSPNWSQNQVLEQAKMFYQGVLYSQLIWMATTNTFTMTNPTFANNTMFVNSRVLKSTSEYFNVVPGAKNHKKTTIEKMTDELQETVTQELNNKQ